MEEVVEGDCCHKVKPMCSAMGLFCVNEGQFETILWFVVKRAGH